MIRRRSRNRRRLDQDLVFESTIAALARSGRCALLELINEMVGAPLDELDRRRGMYIEVGPA